VRHSPSACSRVKDEPLRGALRASLTRSARYGLLIPGDGTKNGILFIGSEQRTL
jgi:hypothetical protein